MSPGALTILLFAVVAVGAILALCRLLDGPQPTRDEFDENWGEQNNPGQMRDWRKAHFPEREP